MFLFVRRPFRELDMVTLFSSENGGSFHHEGVDHCTRVRLAVFVEAESDKDNGVREVITQNH